MNEKHPLYPVIEAECAQVARAACRRFGSLSYEDAYQAAWEVCLRIKGKLEPGLPPGPYFGRALALAIPRYARQQASAVKFPAGHEYKFRIPAVTPVGVRHPDEGGLDVEASIRADDEQPIQEALAIIEDMLAPCRLAPVRAVILDGDPINDAASKHNLAAHQLRTMVNCARMRILEDPRIRDIAERTPSLESMRLIRHHAGANP